MSFQQGLSGLNGAQRALDATSNNVANAGTVGFKLASAQFADVFAASLTGSGASQIGIGATINQVSQQFTQGNITVTNNPLDVAINGSGFFRLSNNGTLSYTRNGQFQVDKNGFIVNAQGLRVTGYGTTATGAIVPGTPVDLQIQTADIAPRPTSSTDIVFNLDSRSVPPSAMTPGALTGSAAIGTTTIAAGVNDGLNLSVDGSAVSVTIPAGAYTNATLATAVQNAINAALPGRPGVTVSVGAGNVASITSNLVGSGSSVTLAGGTGAANLLGGAPTAAAGADNFNLTNPGSFTSSTSQTLFDSKGNPHNFTLYFSKTPVAGQWILRTSLDGSTPAAGDTTALGFNASGQLTTTMPLSRSFTLANGATMPPLSLDLSGSTEFGSIFGVNQMLQDGFTSGRLSGISVAADGVVQGRYSNGQARNLGQVVLVNFNNANGLLSLGGNQWAETSDSGQPLLGVPGTGSLGLLQAAAIEESNVDLTSELVAMITQQRNYQANAQSIKTQDQLLQTLVNLR